MSGLQQIQHVLERTARRRQLDSALRGLWKGVFYGALIILLALATYKLFPVPVVTLAVAGLLAVLLMLGGFIIGGWRRPTAAETARWVDEKSELKERLSSALEMQHEKADARWKDLVIGDASSHVDRLSPSTMLPFHLNRFARWSLLVLILAVGLGFVPEYRSQEYLEAKQNETVIKDTGRILAQLSKRQLENKKPALQPTENALQAVNETGLKLNQAKLTKDEALKELASVADKVNEQMKEMAKNPALRKMDQAMRQQDPTGNTPTSPGDMQKKLDDLQKALGQAADQKDAMDKMKSELEAMKQQAAQMGNQEGGMTDEQKQQMAQQLADMAQKAQQMGMNMPGLDAAMEALMSNQTDFFLKDLELALNDLEKMQQMAQAMEQLQEQLSKLGKDLAEQLEMGQANAAIETLNKMREQLAKSDFSNEDMQKLMAELQKSLNPASEYGKVADKLAKALGQCEGGNNAGASQSLAEAAKELESLMAQMGDMESLMASLKALQMAQMCVGTGQCFGTRPGKGSGWKPGGKPGGGGFGTWTDENGWASAAKPQISELWENGEDTRNLDARGVTDRGDGALAENVNPNKVRGQMSPGGNMPSITLKGVSIKGQSTVDYTEAVTAAQTDAQSALSEQKVPRAYVGSVRDYFDDLK